MRSVGHKVNEQPDSPQARGTWRDKALTLGIAPRRGKPRWLILVAIVALCMGILPAAVALAGPVGNASGFEDDDGNLNVNSTFDWNGFDPTTWTGTAPNRQSTKIASGWQFLGLEDAQAANGDSAFAGGTKQDHSCATIGTGKAPNKDDLKRIYVSSKDVGGKTYLNLAWVRIPQNTTSASAHVGFEFNKGTSGTCAGSNLVQRTAGDMLIVYDFEGGGETPVLTLRRWVTSGACEVTTNTAPCWGVATNLTAGGFAEARVNVGTTALDTIAPVDETLQDSEFGEAGINLTDSGVFPAGTCNSFGKVFGVSRSSGNSSQAAMKDLVGPGNFNLTNCGTVNIIKQTNPRGLNQAFSFTSTLTGAQLSCTADTTPASFSLNDNGNTSSNSTGNTESCANVPAGSYTVTEGADPAGFAFQGVSCTSSGTGTSTSTSGKVVTITMAGGGVVTCTYTNEQQLGAIKITKTGADKSCTGDPLPAGCSAPGVRLLSGATFSIKVGTTAITGSPFTTNANGVVCVDNLAFGPYNVKEESPPTGYATDDTSTTVITVDTNAKCSDATFVGETKTYTNTPLSDIRVTFNSKAGVGVTTATIQCTGDPDFAGGDDAAPVNLPDDSSGRFLDNLVPGTYSCTVVVDP